MDIDYDDLQYRGISDISYSFYPIVLDKYYEPELIDCAFDDDYETYRINGDKNKELSLNDYLNTVRSNVENLSTRKKVIEKKVQLVISLIFLNYITNETVEKWVYSDNIQLRSTDGSKERTTSLFHSLLHRYQDTLENKMEGSSFLYGYVNYLNIKFQQIDLIRGGTYIQTPKWVSNKKATINPKDGKVDDVLCFKYGVTVALNHQEIGNHPERLSKIIPYISK